MATDITTYEEFESVVPWGLASSSCGFLGAPVRSLPGYDALRGRVELSHGVETSACKGERS